MYWIKVILSNEKGKQREEKTLKITTSSTKLTNIHLSVEQLIVGMPMILKCDIAYNNNNNLKNKFEK